MASKFAETVCQCEECKSYCRHRPCWPTPEEAQSLIKAGFGARLMNDYWVSDEDDIHIVSPAIAGYEGEDAPFNPIGRCTFLTEDELCELHDIGLKPFEGRVTTHKVACEGLHEAAAMTWDNSKGRSIVQRWEAIISQEVKEAV